MDHAVLGRVQVVARWFLSDFVEQDNFSLKVIIFIRNQPQKFLPNFNFGKSKSFMYL